MQRVKAAVDKLVHGSRDALERHGRDTLNRPCMVSRAPTKFGRRRESSHFFFFSPALENPKGTNQAFARHAAGIIGCPKIKLRVGMMLTTKNRCNGPHTQPSKSRRTRGTQTLANGKGYRVYKGKTNLTIGHETARMIKHNFTSLLITTTIGLSGR